MPAYSFFRLEFSGGHTGSSTFYECLVTASPAEASAFLAEIFGDSQSASMALFNDMEGIIESYDGDTMTESVSFWPALELTFGDTSLRHRDGLWHMGDIALDGEEMDARFVELEELIFEPATVVVKWDQLGLPAPAHPPLPRGTAVAVTNRAGQTYRQQAGQVAGHLYAGDHPTSYEFRDMPAPSTTE